MTVVGGALGDEVGVGVADALAVAVGVTVGVADPLACGFELDPQAVTKVNVVAAAKPNGSKGRTCRKIPKRRAIT